MAMILRERYFHKQETDRRGSRPNPLKKSFRLGIYQIPYVRGFQEVNEHQKHSNFQHGITIYLLTLPLRLKRLKEIIS